MMISEGSPLPRIRLFRSDRLERLTVVSPHVFVLIWLAVLAFVSFEGWGTVRVPAALGLIVSGVVIWTLFEYVMHRFIFHLTMQSDLGRRLLFLMHGNHHVAPNDRYRNMMPPIVSMAMLSPFWGIFVLVLGSMGSVLFLGFVIGYVVYDSVHYACHQFPMRGPVLGRLRRHHIHHHYAKQEGNYAITAILWDRVFGTVVSLKNR
jgi:sterol desaturase/sphingolipid hydroxylase (fatty acid hydroxylase superfamily)